MLLRILIIPGNGKDRRGKKTNTETLYIMTRCPNEREDRRGLQWKRKQERRKSRKTETRNYHTKGRHRRKVRHRRTMQLNNKKWHFLSKSEDLQMKRLGSRGHLRTTNMFGTKSVVWERSKGTHAGIHSWTEILRIEKKRGNKTTQKVKASAEYTRVAVS